MAKAATPVRIARTALTSGAYLAIYEKRPIFARWEKPAKTTMPIPTIVNGSQAEAQACKEPERNTTGGQRQQHLGEREVEQAPEVAARQRREI